jgi:hypothetical protein
MRIFESVKQAAAECAQQSAPVHLTPNQ